MEIKELKGSNVCIKRFSLDGINTFLELPDTAKSKYDNVICEIIREPGPGEVFESGYRESMSDFQKGQFYIAWPGYGTCVDQHKGVYIVDATEIEALIVFDSEEERLKYIKNYKKEE